MRDIRCCDCELLVAKPVTGEAECTAPVPGWAADMDDSKAFLTAAQVVEKRTCACFKKREANG